MTVTAQGLSPQGLTTPGMGYQPGVFGPPFPAPMGAEQFLGFPQAQGYQQSTWPQHAYASQIPYGIPSRHGQSPWNPALTGYGVPAPLGYAQSSFGSVQPHVPLFVDQILGQILPAVQQVIMPQVIAMTAPIVQQLITQLAASQFAGQPSWAQPAAGSFAPGMRQYAGLS